jgi:hypothetical protein
MVDAEPAAPRPADRRMSLAGKWENISLGHGEVETRQVQLAQEVEIAVRSLQEPQLLDKYGLAAKLLQCAEEKIVRGGQVHYANDAKDRL